LENHPNDEDSNDDTNANGRRLVQDLENQTNDSAPESSSQNNEGYKPLIMKRDH